MISLNTQQKLPGAAFGYLVIGAAFIGVALVVVGIFLLMHGSIPTSTTVNGVTTNGSMPSFWPGIGLILFGLLFPIYQLLWASAFSFVVAERAVTINSGIIIRQSKTIDYNRIQNVDNVRGPIQMLFGITTVNIWTASQDQISFNSKGQRRVRPEGRLYLLSQDAEEVRARMSNKEAVQDVNIVSSQVAPATQVPPQA